MTNDKASNDLVKLKKSIAELHVQIAKRQVVELTEIAKSKYTQEHERGVRNRREARLKIHQLEEENKQLRQERDQARQPTEGQHTDPDDCPTFYDGCNCNVETLQHNISRAEKAEAKIEQLTRQLKELTSDKPNS